MYIRLWRYWSALSYMYGFSHIWVVLHFTKVCIMLPGWGICTLMLVSINFQYNLLRHIDNDVGQDLDDTFPLIFSQYKYETSLSFIFCWHACKSMARAIWDNYHVAACQIKRIKEVAARKCIRKASQTYNICMYQEKHTYMQAMPWKEGKRGSIHALCLGACSHALVDFMGSGLNDFVPVLPTSLLLLYQWIDMRNFCIFAKEKHIVAMLQCQVNGYAWL